MRLDRPMMARALLNHGEVVLLALSGSIFFGLGLVLTQLGLRYVQAADGALVSVPITTLLFWALAPFVIDLSGWHAGAAAIFALVGLFFPACVTLLTYEANQRMGPAITGAIGSTAPLFASVAAVLFLGERISVHSAAATLITVAGIMMLSWPKAGVSRWPMRLVLLPLTAAALRALAQVGTKLGLSLWPSAFAASLIGYSVSVASLYAEARLRRGMSWPTLRPRGTLWFTLVGIANGAAVLSLYAALKSGPITIVAPIVASYPLFALLFGAVMLRDQPIAIRSAIGVLLIVGGIIALILARSP
jgi:drug/metabolite transporter (DMT)-like permease